ncbi:MAG TPA: cellulase family glycosylhydrolase, partial [Solirubrobacteraceae bacterium]
MAVALAAAPASAEPAPAAPLRHAGRWLVDAQGRVVTLRGFNVVDKLPPYAPAAMGFGAEDARFLAAQGFDAMRVGVIPQAVEPRPGRFDDAYLARIARTVTALRRAGLATVLDLHQDFFSEQTGGEGFPPWMVLATGPPGRADIASWDALWDPATGLRDRVAALWRHVAVRLRDVPGIVAFDLLNEPFPGAAAPSCAQLAGCPAFDARLGAFYGAIVRAVRPVAGGRLLLVEPHVIFNGGADTHLDRIGDGLSFHVYCHEIAGVQPCTSREPRVFGDADRWSARTGGALLLTEFGATDDLAAIARTAALADRHRLSWLEWAWWNRDPPGARPAEGIVVDPHRQPLGANVKARKLAVLARPYPRAVAGTPLRWGWDGR